MAKIIGIDLGTTNSVAAVMQRRRTDCDSVGGRRTTCSFCGGGEQKS